MKIRSVEECSSYITSNEKQIKSNVLFWRESYSPDYQPDQEKTWDVGEVSTFLPLAFEPMAHALSLRESPVTQAVRKTINQDLVRAFPQIKRAGFSLSVGLEKARNGWTGENCKGRVYRYNVTRNGERLTIIVQFNFEVVGRKPDILDDAEIFTPWIDVPESQAESQAESQTEGPNFKGNRAYIQAFLMGFSQAQQAWLRLWQARSDKLPIPARIPSPKHAVPECQHKGLSIAQIDDILKAYDESSPKPGINVPKPGQSSRRVKVK